MNSPDELEDDGMDVADVLSDISADLLGHTRYRPFLDRLFNVAPGEWHTLAELCVDLSNIETRLNAPLVINAQIWVAWLPHPATSPTEQLCIIAFFSDVPDWRSLAVFNKGLFLRKIPHPP
jgi:hypothetical protein